MKIIKGTCNEAYVYTDLIDEATIAQLEKMCSLPFLKNEKIRIMPDVHAGSGCTIGTTMTITDAVVPNFVGVDIGCGMEVAILKESTLDFQKLDETINTLIPSGFHVRNSPHAFNQDIDLTALRCASEALNLSRVRLSLGTLGGGNHFIEVDRDQQGHLYLVIHSGSRMLGNKVAAYYQREAFLANNHASQKNIASMIDELKRAGRAQEIQATIAKMKAAVDQSEMPYAYCEGELMADYLHDMALTQKFAMLNRQAMMDVIVTAMGLHVVDHFTTIHNYIDMDHMILRKGAVSAKQGERLIIPMNMRDGSLLCVGKGNDDWNQSAPHGAGRLMSRKEAFEKISLSSFQEAMQGVYSTSVAASTIDESPFAYKPMTAILENITPTADVIDILKPLYNFKAKEAAPDWRKKKA